MLSPETVSAYISALQEELVPATGCTEPIAIAYAAAHLRRLLPHAPEFIRAEVSGNIIKNVKSVVVPNTGGLKGISAAIAAGIVAGDADLELQVIAHVPDALQSQISTYLAETPMEIVCAQTTRMLDIQLTGEADGHTAVVHIANSHTNVVRLERDGEILLERPLVDSAEDSFTDKSFMSVAGILEFARTVELDRVEELLSRQIEYNSAIAQEGLEQDWGAGIGKMLLRTSPESIKTEARAWAAAGSDARMSGCEKPVVILSGSGNQGMTASLPVIRYANHFGVGREQLLRALLVSDLVTIHQKTGIGRLSAYCGAISAGVGAGAGIAYLMDGSFQAVAHTICNAVAMLSGTICDGAKPSCAAKIANSVEAGILGYQMYTQGHNFQGGDGILAEDVEATIANVGILARQGMQVTDRTILQIMTDCVD